MEEKKLLERHAYFFNEINRLNEIPLEEEPDLGSIGISKAGIQMAYRDIGVLKFKGGIFDYLSYLSTETFLRDWLKNCKIGIYDFPIYEKMNNVLRLVFKNPKYFFKSEFYSEIRKLIKIDDSGIFHKLVDFRFKKYYENNP